ncbi:hypothetical protein KA005_53610 [bacterium]|nr:hypothetical protein [bacterium]
MKKLWLVRQDENNGYDTYDELVVCAETEEEARQIHPAGYFWREGKWMSYNNYSPTKDEWVECPLGSWCSSPDKVNVTFIGEADESVAIGIVLGSYNAG